MPHNWFTPPKKTYLFLDLFINLGFEARHKCALQALNSMSLRGPGIDESLNQFAVKSSQAAPSTCASQEREVDTDSRIGSRSGYHGLRPPDLPPTQKYKGFPRPPAKTWKHLLLDRVKPNGLGQ